MLTTPQTAPAHGPAPAIADVTTASFAADVLQASRAKPVLVDFWAPWCGPCKQLQPALERVAKLAGDAVTIVKLNIDEHPAVAGQLGIQSIPAVVAFVKGQPVDGFMGALPEAQIVAFIERLVGPLAGAGHDETLAAARQAVEAGDLAAAAQLYAAVLADEADNAAAIAGFARVQLAAGNVAAAEAALASAPAAKANDPDIVAARAEIALAAQSANLGDARDLQARVEVDPEDHQARFDLALALAARGDRAEATSHLLHIVKRDRAWNDDGARKQLVQFFEAWGVTDAATVDGRRRLSSILFA